MPDEILIRIGTLPFRDSPEVNCLDWAISAAAWLLREVATGVGIGTAVTVVLVLVVILAYRPRMRRGSFWLPAFGLFGGTPTLYLHTRPVSFCGIFSHSRRLRSRPRR
ncbi:MAG: hypothetical protein AB9869_34870 [Verrucomicrobiia bacterium]